MKKIFVLIVMLFSALLFAQTPNWTGVKETNINVVSASSTDIFTNRDGNHIIVQEGNNLKYYRMNLNGYSDPAIFPKTIESVGVSSPSISGDANNIYIVYGVGNSVRTKRSTDKGISWSTITNHIYQSAVSGTEIVFSNNNLHVTFQRDNKIWYRYRNQSGSWIDEREVSINESGVKPRITARYEGANADYVYFLWQKSGTHQFKHRRYEVTSNAWGSPLLGYTVSVPNLLSSNPAGIRVTGSTIIVYYSYYAIDEYGNYQYYFNWAWRNLSNNTEIGVGFPNLNQTQRVYTTTTFDNQSHTAFYYAMIAGGEGGSQTDFAIWRSKQISGYPDDVIYEYQDYQYNQPIHVNVSSAGNEVHAIWKDDYGNNNGNNLRYKWDNQNPIAPQNLTMSSHNNHPKLVWQKNPEQDVDYYRIYRRIGSLPYTLHTTVSASLPTEYVDNEQTVCNPPPGAQCQSGTVAKYYVTARDLTSKESAPSNEVEAIIQGLNPYKIAVNNPTEVIDNYELSQNYPNPFNPSTTINYSIQSSGLVLLKVYDLLGIEVVDLVNEVKEAGNYSVTFNASELPSGIYFYTLTSGNFMATKKLILLK